VQLSGALKFCVATPLSPKIAVSPKQKLSIRLRRDCGVQKRDSHAAHEGRSYLSLDSDRLSQEWQPKINSKSAVRRESDGTERRKSAIRKLGIGLSGGIRSK